MSSDPSPENRLGGLVMPFGLTVGDTITFASRPVWWRRTLIRLGWMKPPPLKQFVVSWTNAEGRD